MFYQESSLDFLFTVEDLIATATQAGVHVFFEHIQVKKMSQIFGVDKIISRKVGSSKKLDRNSKAISLRTLKLF